MTFRPEVERIVDALLVASEESGVVTLDDVGAAVGVAAVTPDEIDAFMGRLEEVRKVEAPEGARGEGHLRTVLWAIRAFTAKSGRRPTLAEVARDAALEESDVRNALALARVMGR